MPASDILGIAQSFSVAMAMVVALYAALISWRLRGIENVQAKDVRWVCCGLMWILLMWPLRYFGRRLEVEYLVDVVTVAMVPLMVMMVVSICRMYAHLVEDE